MATESLAKRGGAALTLRPELAELTNDLTKPDAGFSDYGGGVPFVGFVDQKSGNLADLLAAGLAPGDIYLSHLGDRKNVKLSPFEFMLIKHRQLWVQTDNTYKNVLAVTDRDPRSYKDPRKENILSVVVVFTPDGPVAATANFKTTKAEIGRVALRELAKATTPEWAKQSGDHKLAAGVPLPFARFYVTGTTYKDTAKGSGLPMYVGRAKATVVTPDRWNQVNQFINSEEGAAEIKAAYDVFTARVKELEAKINNG